MTMKKVAKKPALLTLFSLGEGGHLRPLLLEVLKFDPLKIELSI